MGKANTVYDKGTRSINYKARKEPKVELIISQKLVKEFTNKYKISTHAYI